MKLILYQATMAITEIDFVPGPFRCQIEQQHLDFAVEEEARRKNLTQKLTAPAAGPGAGVAAACCRTLAPSSSPGIPLHPPALRCARRPRGGCPRPASLLARPQPACTQRSKLPAPPVLRRRRAVSGRKSGDRRQGSTWRRAAPVWGCTRAAGPRHAVVCASLFALR